MAREDTQEQVANLYREFVDAFVAMCRPTPKPQATVQDRAVQS